MMFISAQVCLWWQAGESKIHNGGEERTAYARPEKLLTLLRYCISLDSLFVLGLSDIVVGVGPPQIKLCGKHC